MVDEVDLVDLMDEVGCNCNPHSSDNACFVPVCNVKVGHC